MIAFDLDGVICDSHHIYRGHFFDRFGVIIQKEDLQPTFEFEVTSGEFPDKWYEEIPVAISKYQHICPSYAGAIRALDAIRVQFSLPWIQIITAREPSKAVMRVTKLWCQNNFTFPYNIDFCASSEEKVDIIQLMEIKYFIDDRFKTAKSLAPHLKYSYLLNRNWNINRDEFLLPNVERVDSLWQMKNHMSAAKDVDSSGQM